MFKQKQYYSYVSAFWQVEIILLFLCLALQEMTELCFKFFPIKFHKKYLKSVFIKEINLNPV